MHLLTKVFRRVIVHAKLKFRARLMFISNPKLRSQHLLELWLKPIIKKFQLCLKLILNTLWTDTHLTWMWLLLLLMTRRRRLNCLDPSKEISHIRIRATPAAGAAWRVTRGLSWAFKLKLTVWFWLWHWLGLWLAYDSASDSASDSDYDSDSDSVSDSSEQLSS